MKTVLLIVMIFALFAPTEAILAADKERVSMITIYSTLALFLFSILTFATSLTSYLKNRKLRQFKLSEPQVYIYYKDKEKAPKLRRKVLEAMDKGGSTYQKASKNSDGSTTRSVDTESTERK